MTADTRQPHTPGPWTVEEVGIDTAIVRTSSGHDIGTGDMTTACAIPIGDARLIAAAPDLLAALKQIVEHEQIDGTGIRYVFDWHSPFGQQARAAVAKAEGR